MALSLRCVLLFATVALATGVSAHHPAATFADKLANLFTPYNFTGVVQVWKRSNGSAASAGTEEPVAVELYGSDDITGRHGIQSDAVFPIGSNTKLMTAVSLYQLQEQGNLNLTQDISDLITPSDLQSFGFPPSVTRLCLALEATPTKCESVTISDLLGMQSGMSNGGGMDTWLFSPYRGSLAATIAKFIQSPLLFKPRKGWYYSNAGYVLATWFVEKYNSDGMPFTDYLQKNIFDVVGMPDTELDMYNGQLGYHPRRVGEFYQYIQMKNASSGSSPPLSEIAKGRCSVEIPLGAANGAGGVLSTQADVRKWYFTLFNFSVEATSLLKKDSLMQIVNNAATPPYDTGNGWCYAQGIGVSCPSMYPLRANGAPQKVTYMGGTVCSRTGNLMTMSEVVHENDTTTQQPQQDFVIFQAYQSNVVLPTTKEALRAFKHQANLTIFDVRGALIEQNGGVPYPDPQTIVFEMNALYKKFYP